MTGLAAAERRRCTAERLRILAADPAALNTWEQQVLGALAPLGPTEALPAEAFMRQAGYAIKRRFGEMVERLEHAQFLECRGPGWFALTEHGRSALGGARAKRLQLHRRHWLTPAESTILARLATASGAGWVQLGHVRATLELPADHTYRTIQQLVVAGYVTREYRAVRITDAGRHALTRLGRSNEADVLDVSAYAQRFSSAYLAQYGTRSHLRALPPTFRRAARAYILDELERGRGPEGVQNSLRALRSFLRFVVARHTDAVDFAALEMADVDALIDQRSRDRAGIPSRQLARVAHNELSRTLQVLDALRTQADPLVPQAFTTLPFRQRVRIASGAVQLRAQRALRVVPDPDELLTPEERTQAELEKDRWEIANLAGVRRNPTGGVTRLDFVAIPAAFRPVVKDYFRVVLLVTGRSPSHAYAELRRLRAFLQFYALRRPTATTLADLTIADVDAWVAQLRASPQCPRPAALRRGRGRRDYDRAALRTLPAAHGQP